MPTAYYPGNYFNPPGASTPAGGPPGGYFGAEWYASGPWGSEYYRGAGPLPPDLVAAVVARLRSQGVGSALGEAGSVRKIWTDEALSSPALPWVRITELGETPRFTTGSAYVAEGTLQLSVFASGKKAARDIARSVMAAVDLAPLAFADGRTMNVLHGNARGVVEDGPGVGAAAVYHHAVDIRYTVQRTIGS